MTSIISAPLVLIADDLPDVLRNYEVTLHGYGIRTMQASSLTGLYAIHDRWWHELSAIILDGCIPGHALNTIGFIRYAHYCGFTQPIIAASSLKSYRDQMQQAGCSHQAPKELAAELVADLLTRP